MITPFLSHFTSSPSVNYVNSFLATYPSNWISELHHYLTQKPLCLSLGLLARSSTLLPLSPSGLFPHSSQSEPFTEVKLWHCSLQVFKSFPISLSQIQYLHHSPLQCLQALHDLATASSLISSITPHQLLHPSFPASATLLFPFFHHTTIHKNINSMRLFYKLLHPLNQEQCLAQSYIH